LEDGTLKSLAIITTSQKVTCSIQTVSLELIIHGIPQSHYDQGST